MTKKILGGLFTLVIAAVAAFNVNMNVNMNMNTESNDLSLLSLANAEALANEINYHVPDRSNDPSECTLSIWVSGSAGANGGEVSAGGGYVKVNGIKNTCRSGSSGCDPYNCHQRVG